MRVEDITAVPDEEWLKGPRSVLPQAPMTGKQQLQIPRPSGLGMTAWGGFGSGISVVENACEGRGEILRQAIPHPLRMTAQRRRGGEAWVGMATQRDFKSEI